MKKFEITKEQILELSKSVRNYDDLKQWFPEAFKIELEVGEWYKHVEIKNSLVFKISELGYGWFNGIYKENEFWSIEDYNLWIEATPKEVETALINEAKKRGFEVGTCFLDIEHEGYEVCSDEIKICDSCECLSLQFGEGNGLIYYKGKWAKIIQTITKEEAEKKLNCKII